MVDSGRKVPTNVVKAIGGPMTTACQRLEVLSLTGRMEEPYKGERRMNGGTASSFLRIPLSQGRSFFVIEYVHPVSV